MAGVPTYESQLAERPLPTPYDDTRVSPAAYGAGVGQGLQQLSEGVGDVARYEKQNADAAVVINAVAQAKDAYNSVILDDKAGYSSLRGKDAMDGRDQAIQAFNSKLERIGSGLQNDQQRLHFAQFANTIREQAVTHAIAHESVERERYSQAGFRGAVDQTMVTMENPSVIASSTSLQQQIDSLYQTGIAEAQRRYGASASKDAIASVVVPELQKAALGTMEAATAAAEQGGDPAVAKQAFDQVGKYLVVGHQRQYAARIEALTKKTQVQARAAQIVAGATDSVPVPGGDPIPRVDPGKLAAGLEALDPSDRYTPDVLKAAEQQEQLRAKVWNAAAGQIVKRVYSAGQDPDTGAFNISSPNISAQDKAWLQLNEPDLYGRLYARSQADLRRDVNSPPTPAERRTAVALRVDIADHPEKYISTTEDQYAAKYFDQLAPRDYSAIGNVLGNLQKNVAKMSATAEKVLPDKVDSMLVALGRGKVFPGGKKPPAQWKQDDVDLYMKAREGVLSQAAQFVATTGKPPAFVDYECFIRNEFVQGTVPHEEPIFPGITYTFRDSAYRVQFEAHPEKFRGTAFVPNIPADARTSIIQAFQRRGVKAPTEAQVQGAYGAMGTQAAPAAAATQPVQTGPGGQPIPQFDTSQPLVEPEGGQ